MANGLPIGSSAVPALARNGSLSPRQAVEHVLLEALVRPPCVVSFSGGRDSSALLALALAVARREGLPDPIPATLTFPSSAEADESAWQTLVLQHLGATGDWIRLKFTDELDAVGPVAQRALARHGLLWPFNLHSHLPIIEAAAGGSLVTGFGGDEVAQSSANLHAERLLTRRTVRGFRDLRAIGYRLSPMPLRYLAEIARCGFHLADVTWLTPRAWPVLRASWGVDVASVPMGWSRVLRDWIWRSRYFRVCKENFAIMGEAVGVRTFHPFVEPTVLQSLAAFAPFAGLGGRGRILELLVGDLLPHDVVQRPTKSVFTDTLWTATARRFAVRWSGHGLDERFVDPEKVRSAWLDKTRAPRATTLLQAAWLADNPRTP